MRRVEDRKWGARRYIKERYGKSRRMIWLEGVTVWAADLQNEYDYYPLKKINTNLFNIKKLKTITELQTVVQSTFGILQ